MAAELESRDLESDLRTLDRRRRELAFKIAEHFGLPVEAVFSPRPFRALSEQVYEVHKREA
jgi:hypothetical protein